MNILLNKLKRRANSLVKNYSEGYLKNRIKLFQQFGISFILDVGANTGQYAYYTRKSGYRNKIISFEPQKKEFALLSEFASKDKLWSVENYALGDTNGKVEINISSDSQCSSILEMMPSHLKSLPNSDYIGQEEVTICKIDTIIGNFVNNLEKTFMKIDTQGFEKNVLAGADESLKHIIGLQVELSLIELYKGEVLYDEMISFIRSKGFRIYSLEPGFYDKKSGRLLQADGIFFRP